MPDVVLAAGLSCFETIASDSLSGAADAVLCEWTGRRNSGVLSLSLDIAQPGAIFAGAYAMMFRKVRDFGRAFRFAGLSFLIFAAQTSIMCGALIPANREIDWSQVGVPGGIPNVTNVFTTLTSIDNTGATDVSGAINGALNSCPAGRVVMLPAGTFLVNNTINMNNGVVLRGQGANTVLLGNVNSTIINFYGPYGYWDRTNLASGYTKGSTNLVLASMPADIHPGMQVQITEHNDTNLVDAFDYTGTSYAGDYALGQWVSVQSVQGNSITVWPPLYYTYTNAMTPMLYYSVNYNNPSLNFMQYAGVENLVVSNINPGGNEVNISMAFAAYCWVKNVQSYWGSICHLWTYDTYRCEIRDSQFTGVTAPITSSRCYGLQTGTPNSPNPASKTTAMLIENNVWTSLRGAIFLGYGASGCVIGYNCFASMTNEVPSILRADISFHSAHSYMNLIEGNVGTKINADDFHGSSSHNTIFRNYWRGRPANPSVVSSLTSVECDEWQRYYNVIGNVLGYPNVVQEVSQLANPAGGALVEVIAPAANWSYGDWYKALMFGYNGEGGGTVGYDPKVVATVLLTGNFDYVSGQVNWDVNGVQTLPSSLYLAGLPSWWPDPTSTPWPPIGSDLTNMAGMIPAQARSLGIVLLSQTNPVTPVTPVTPPPPPQGLHILH